ncbi:MAG TPA: hypothetical protein VHW64_14090 [Nocardioides sp.]|uniref:hypothetical protein n=1 Tax=Nocardioides sp. TaxID=35761 RepID=UPI002E32657B|nr:hypothetical protein [Nocardioides sp.]HEX3931831.1 hypothetical protein [Nocardioides sp.]
MSAVALSTALSLTLAGCGGGSSSPSSSPSGSTGPDAAAPAGSTLVLGRVAGDLHQPNKRVFARHRKQVLDDVGKAVDSWVDGGFVAVSYPRSSFGSAFAAFTAPARKDAEHQRRLMTNWDLRKQIDGVHVVKRKVTVDVLAPHGRPAGATARVSLVFTTTGDATKRVMVHGRLFLSPDDLGTWQIFGYDVAKGGQ